MFSILLETASSRSYILLSAVSWAVKMVTWAFERCHDESIARKRPLDGSEVEARRWHALSHVYGVWEGPSAEIGTM